MKNIPPPKNYDLHSNLGAGMSIDLIDDFLWNFGADVREACQHVPPVFASARAVDLGGKSTPPPPPISFVPTNKKSATVLPFPTVRRPAVPSVHNQEVTPCSSDICLSPTSES